MPDRVAITRITIGVENRRKVYMPGEQFTVTDAQARELDAYDPPIVADPRAPRPEVMAGQEGAEAVTRVAEPLRPDNSGDGGTTTREEPKDEL